MRRVADLVMTRLASLLTHVFFRSIEIEGADRLPLDGPLIAISNHNNGLVDGFLLMSTLRRYPRFLGKSTLFRILPLRPFLELAGVVPVHRRADSGGGRTAEASNDASFRTCRGLLGRGGVVALFPEGVSHDELALQPLRTGAARIALGAAADDGTGGVLTVAVGLVYDAKATFRSRALVRIGPPCAVDPYVEQYRDDPRGTVRELTRALSGQLQEVVTTHRSWREAEILGAVADLVLSEAPGRCRDEGSAGGPLDPQPSLADRERVAAALAAIDLGSSAAGRRLEEAYLAYERDLALLGVTDRQVRTGYGYRRAPRLVWSLVKIAGGLPVGALGAAVHVLPYQATRIVARLPRNESIRSTVKLLGCTVSFTVTYVTIAEIVRRRRGAPLGFVAAAICPLSGYVTLRLGDRLREVGGAIEGARALSAGETRLPALLRRRAEIVDRAARLAGGESALEG